AGPTAPTTTGGRPVRRWASRDGRAAGAAGGSPPAGISAMGATAWTGVIPDAQQRGASRDDDRTTQAAARPLPTSGGTNGEPPLLPRRRALALVATGSYNLG